MPKDILRNKKLLIGFDPRLFTKKSLIFFLVKIMQIFTIKKNLIDKIWKRRIEK